MNNQFNKYRAYNENPKWEHMISRCEPLYSRNNNLRSEFQRDHTRILNTNAYKRMKHKTQVFFQPKSDHICTRGEHVNLVDSISYTISNYLGLNTELTRAIAISHDIGHSPFGHAGEKILSEISQRDLGTSFWHEQNGLNMVDNVELLEDLDMNMRNLNLTYAVRDGIISHCGEVDENTLKPRDEYIDLNNYTKPNQYAPFTWEGCVLRDIKDAIELHIIDNDLEELYKRLNMKNSAVINNTTIVNNLIYDICTNSTPEKGLYLSADNLHILNTIKQFNYEKIYLNERIIKSHKYFSLVLNELYNILKDAYDGENTLLSLNKMHRFYPALIDSFTNWISSYWDITDRTNTNLKNKVIVNIKNEKEYYKAIIYYLSGMTDNFAINTYMQIIRF
jgi:dGTPase